MEIFLIPLSAKELARWTGYAKTGMSDEQNHNG